MNASPLPAKPANVSSCSRMQSTPPPRARHVRRSLTSWLVATVVAACGGGGGGDGGGGGASPATPQATTPPAPVTPSATTATTDRFVLGTILDLSEPSTPLSNPLRVYKATIVDPAQPGSSIQVDDLGTANRLLAGALANYTYAYSYDAAARTRTYDGAAVMLYINNNRLFAVDLRAGWPHAPRQLSALTDACTINADYGLLQLNANGQDAWIPVGRCAGGTSYVRLTMSPVDVPVDLGGATFIEVLDDGTMNALGVLMLDAQGLSFYSRDLVRLALVAGAGAVNTLPQNGVRDYLAVQSIFYRFGNVMRRLTWNTTGATLDPPVYSFSSAETFAAWRGDLDAMYFADGNTVLKLISGGTPNPLATFPGASIFALYLTTDRIVIQQANRSDIAANAISSILKTGGPITAIASVGGSSGVLGTTPDAIYYLRPSEARLAKADGSGDISVPRGAFYQQRRQSADRLYLEGVGHCVADVTTDSACSNSTYFDSSLQAPSSPPSIQGRVTHSTRYQFGSFGNGSGFDVVRTTSGVPELLSFYDAAGLTGHTRDLYVWTPGVPNTLARSTFNVN